MIASFAERRAEIVAALAPPPRRRARPPSCPTRCSTKSPRWSNGRSSTPARSIRRSSRAAGMPDPHDAAEPEIFRAGRRATASSPRGSSSSAISRRPTRRRSSRATSACCARGSPTPASSSTRTGRRGSRRASRSSPRSSTTTSSARSSIGWRALVQLAGDIAAMIGADRGESARAAQLAKADLVTDMVGEFPELQGLMGRYYAEHDGEPPSVAAAIEQHYWPRFAGDALPAAAGRAGGRAGRQARDARRHVRHRRAADRRQGPVRPASPRDRRDPHPHREGAARDAGRARRRRLSRLRGVPAVQDARAELATSSTSGCAAPARCRLLGEPGRGRAVPAARSGSISSPRRPRRSRPSASCRKPKRSPPRTSGSSTSCASPKATRRSRSIAPASPTAPSTTSISPSRSSSRSSTIAARRGDFAGALLALATAKPAVDRFFDDVLVMADDPAIRANRLALLRGVAQTMNRVADISKLAA